VRVLAGFSYLWRFCSLLPILCSLRLQFAAEEFEDHVANAGADHADEEIVGSDHVVKGDGEGLALPIGSSELAHEEIGIEEKDDECNFDDGSPDGLEPGSRSYGRHGAMIAAEARGPKCFRIDWRGVSSAAMPQSL
jgi:hypothetical protein